MGLYSIPNIQWFPTDMLLFVALQQVSRYPEHGSYSFGMYDYGKKKVLQQQMPRVPHRYVIPVDGIYARGNQGNLSHHAPIIRQSKSHDYKCRTDGFIS